VKGCSEWYESLYFWGTQGTLGWGPHTIYNGISYSEATDTEHPCMVVTCTQSKAQVTDAAKYLLVLPNVIVKVKVKLKNHAQNHWRRQSLGTSHSGPSC